MFDEVLKSSRYVDFPFMYLMAILIMLLKKLESILQGASTGLY